MFCDVFFSWHLWMADDLCIFFKLRHFWPFHTLVVNNRRGGERDTQRGRWLFQVGAYCIWRKRQSCSFKLGHFPFVAGGKRQFFSSVPCFFPTSFMPLGQTSLCLSVCAAPTQADCFWERLASPCVSGFFLLHENVGLFFTELWSVSTEMSCCPLDLGSFVVNIVRH